MAGNPIVYFSYSRLSTYDHCQYRFKLQYIDRLTKPDESIEAFVGKRVHETLEYLYQLRQEEKMVPVFDDLLVYYREQWVKHWHNRIGRVQMRLPLTYYERLGEECIARYYRTSYPFTENVIGIEKEIEFLLDDDPQFRFKGIIDRIDQNPDDTVTITDYKTGKKALSQKQADSDLQLTIYQLGIEAAGLDTNQAILRWYFLQVGKIITSVRTPSQHTLLTRKVKQKAENILEHVANGKSFLARETMLCNWCYFWEECPVKNATNPYVGNLK